MESLAQALIAVYASYEAEMLKYLGTQLDRAEHGELITRLEEDTAYARALAEEATTAARNMVEGVADEAIRDVMSRLEEPRNTFTVSPGVYEMLFELTSSLEQLEPRILRVADDIFKEVVALGSAESMLIGQPLRIRHRNLWQKFVAQGIHGYTSSDGRNWSLTSYVEMASRTTVANAYRAQQRHTLQANDLNLVVVHTTSDACEICARWSGKVLSLDNRAAGDYLMESTLTGTEVWTTIDASHDEALADGLFHPNCQCTHGAYFPGDKRPTPTPYNEAEHSARMSQRYHERKIRQLKREQLADLSYDYGHKIRHHQKAIRTLVSDYGLNRKSYREQVDFSK